MCAATNGALYQLVDLFTLFYLRFVEGAADSAFWTNRHQSALTSSWKGYAFELVCLHHVQQVQQALGIAAIATDVSSWRSRESTPGAQIDLVIDRADGIVDLCEMKWSATEYTLTKQDNDNLQGKLQAFAAETKTRKALRTVLVTPYGIKNNAYANNIQATVTSKELFT